MAGRHHHLSGLARAIHETIGLKEKRFIRDLLGSDEFLQGWGQEEFLEKLHNSHHSGLWFVPW